MKEFNITGTCIPHLHYMVDISNKLNKVIELIEKGKYFVISRPRQYGKTTMLSVLYRQLSNNENYILIKTSFEGLGDESFQDVKSFANAFLLELSEELKKEEELLSFIQEQESIQTIKELDIFLSELVHRSKKKVILIIDEVDKASNFNLFLSFLGMLRDKYLKRAEGKDTTFHSVVLSGLHDIKNIKLKMHPDSDSQYNSPWNIATDFKIDMSFSPEEIETMLNQWIIDNGQVTIDVSQLSKEIYKYTSGYPFLVSRICKLIDEELDRDWSVENIQKAIDVILKERNTLFDDLIKNIENHGELLELLKDVLIDQIDLIYNIDNPVINKAVMYGMIRSTEKSKIIIHNKIFEVRLFNYLTSKIELSNRTIHRFVAQGIYLNSHGDLDMEKVLLKFQEFIKSTYSENDIEFYERHGRLLLIAFIKPIINGSGFYFLEPQHSYERRSDMIITFNNKEYILELKLWHGEKYHQDGLKQLAGYLKSKNHKIGYLVAFNFNKSKEFTNKWNDFDGRKIFQVLV